LQPHPWQCLKLD